MWYQIMIFCAITLNYCFEVMPSPEEVVEPEDDSNSGPENTGQNEKSHWRQATPGKKKFKIHICIRLEKKIAPKRRTTKTQNTLDSNSLPCVQEKKIHHVQLHLSTRELDVLKKHGPYMRLKAVCTFSDCKAKYVFTCNKPAQQNRNVTISVNQFGCIRHAKAEQTFRGASDTRRGKITKAIKNGISNFYY